NLDIAIVGQLAATDFPLGDQFEACAVQMVRFEAALRSRCVGQQGLKHATANTHDALIFADADSGLDGRVIGVPASIRWKAEEPCALLPAKLTGSRYCSQWPGRSRPILAQSGRWHKLRPKLKWCRRPT